MLCVKLGVNFHKECVWFTLNIITQMNKIVLTILSTDNTLKGTFVT